jgi:hypothetical protein
MTTILESVKGNHISNCLNTFSSSLINQFLLFSLQSLRFGFGIFDALMEIFDLFFNLFSIVNPGLQRRNFSFLLITWFFSDVFELFYQLFNSLDLFVIVSQFFLKILKCVRLIGLRFNLLGSAGTHFQKLYLNLLIISIAVLNYI